MSKYSGTVKGLNIAAIVVSALFLLLLLICLAAVVAAYNSGTMDYSYTFSNGVNSYSKSGIVDASNLIVQYGYNVIVGTIIFCIVCAVVSIVAAIIGIRKCKQPDTIGPAFAMAIVGAVLTFFSGNLVSMVLHIIAAVFSNKVKNDTGIPAQQYAAAQQGSNQS